MMDIEKLEVLFERSFDMLNTEERELALTMVENEQEYESMREFYRNVESHEILSDDFVPKAALKEDLDELFYQIHPKDKGVGLLAFIPVVFPQDKKLWQQPVLRIAAILVLALLLVPFFNNEQDEVLQLAEVKSEEKELNLNDPIKTEEIKESTASSTSENAQQSARLPNEREEVGSLATRTVITDIEVPTPSVSAAGSPHAGLTPFNHPDGLYEESVLADDLLPFSEKPIATRPIILDFLTASF
jgi:hypothetical protein